jgi:hypothetical protein
VIPELRPRGIGEMLDAAVTLYRARFTSLMFVSAIVVIPVQILSSLVLLSARPDNFGYSFGTTGPQYESNPALQLGATITVLIVNVASTAFVVGACTRIVAEAYIDQSATSQQALGNAGRRFFAILGVSLIVAVAQFIGVFACFVGTFVPMALFAVAVPALILERIGVSLSLGRSVNLVKSHFWRTLGLVVTAQFLTTIVSFGLTIAAELFIRGDSSSTSGIIAQGLAAAIAALLTTAFVATATVVLYFDLRIREEAFDVQLMLQRDDARFATA